MLRFKIILTVFLTIGLLFTSHLYAQFDNSAETGPVGVYSDDAQGTRTALGALYDMNQLTCAHKFYPTGTLLQISRIDNGLSTVVEVNDRLSVRSDNVIRLSKAAAQELNIDPSLVSIVRIDPLGKPRNNTPTAYYNTSPSALSAAGNFTAKGGDVPQAYDAVPQQPVTLSERAPKLQFPTVFGSPAPVAAASPGQPQAYDYTPRNMPQSYNNTTTIKAIPQSYGNLTVKGIAANPSASAPTAYETTANTSLRNLTTYYVQVAAFSKYDNADRYQQNLLRRGLTDLYMQQAQKADGTILYRVRMGPYPNLAEANRQKRQLANEYRLRGIVMKGE